MKKKQRQQTEKQHQRQKLYKTTDNNMNQKKNKPYRPEKTNIQQRNDSYLYKRPQHNNKTTSKKTKKKFISDMILRNYKKNI